LSLPEKNNCIANTTSNSQQKWHNFGNLFEMIHLTFYLYYFLWQYLFKQGRSFCSAWPSGCNSSSPGIAFCVTKEQLLSENTTCVGIKGARLVEGNFGAALESCGFPDVASAVLQRRTMTWKVQR
jgi:hypothetical protein